MCMSRIVSVAVACSCLLIDSSVAHAQLDFSGKVQQEAITNFIKDRKTYSHAAVSSGRATLFEGQQELLNGSGGQWQPITKEPAPANGKILSLAGTDARPGDVVLLRRSNDTIPLVYLGERRFPKQSEQSKPVSFFIFPMLAKVGLEFNTMPMRWNSDFLTVYVPGKYTLTSSNEWIPDNIVTPVGTFTSHWRAKPIKLRDQATWFLPTDWWGANATWQVFRRNSAGKDLTFDRKIFFAEYRKHFDAVSQTQVDGLETLLAAFESDRAITHVGTSPNASSIRWIAYMLATVQHETHGTFTPIEETCNDYLDVVQVSNKWRLVAKARQPSLYPLTGKAAAIVVGEDKEPIDGGGYLTRDEAIGKEREFNKFRYFGTRYGPSHRDAARFLHATAEDGATFYGRGYAQLTWKKHYKDFGETYLSPKQDLVKQPNLALDPAIAYQIMSYGMREGKFTGKKLANYITATSVDYTNARRIINADVNENGETIANYATAFEAILTAARE